MFGVNFIDINERIVCDVENIESDYFYNKGKFDNNVKRYNSVEN